MKTVLKKMQWEVLHQSTINYSFIAMEEVE